MSKPKLSYITIKTSEINTVDFSQLIEQKDTRRESLDKSEFIVKWVEGAPTIPASIEAVPESDRGNILTHSEAVELMKSVAWTEPIE
jgi:hypothetical protein